MSAPQYPGQQAQYGAPPPKKSMSGCVIAIVVLVVLAVPAIGIFATLAIYGVRKYLAAAKTAEAKNSVGAISRAAVMHYDDAKDFCGPASPVPAAVPKGVKYQPSATGADFDTGDAKNGWRCLRFSMTQPIYYQYHYTSGSGWLTPVDASRGTIVFEATAMGDLNGDGVPSKFGRSGYFDASHALVLAPQLYIENEFE